MDAVAAVYFAYIEFPQDIPHDMTRHESPLGYRHQCRWKSNEMFFEPSILNFDYHFFFDTDSYFPPLEVNERPGSTSGGSTGRDFIAESVNTMKAKDHVYAYVHKTREKDSMVVNLWDFTLLYMGMQNIPRPIDDVDSVELLGHGMDVSIQEN